MKTFIKWFAGFFEDQKGSASSKRGALYILLFMHYLLIKASAIGVVVNETVLYINTVLILFCLGAITSEFFTNLKLPIVNQSTKTVEITSTKESTDTKS